ncbi:uncharacterized protein N7503_009234 [Penicillium pulvis]|uniref:uncharacterized protein n=1 Tax=Penicillium pulvis TaxID=1562058 RepID=UPI0025488E36|nr:uncharacterized protein N7503_009234 [Penicillium pulvis]KAJ5793256.1 hypothetical protein N7503_009234 [Penicillium pulvis]
MIACFFLGSVLAYGLVMTFYRLHVHPLSKYPGPWLAAVTGLYEIYFAAWGVGSFEDEIDRMHQKYGPVVRITPDEVHVQEQLYHTSYADGWIKGTERLDSGRSLSSKPSQRFQIKKRSISRARSILQVEVPQIIRGLIQRHQLHRVFGASFPLIPLPGGHETRSDPEESDLEEGQHRVDRTIGPVMPNQNMAMSSTA